VPQKRFRTAVTIPLRSTATRFLVLAPALLAIFGCWFVVRWYVANTVAEYTSVEDPDAIEMARLAVRWAPADPFTHWKLAAIAERNFSAANLAEAAREYQKTVLLSPHDYRYWMELGGGLEAAGDEANGEVALRRAVELAPAYAQPRWFLGNLLLREGKTEEGFEHVRRAAMADEQMRTQLLNVAWQLFNGDIDSIVKVACPTADLRVQFATYLVSRKKFDDALRVWNTLARDEKSQQAALANGLKQQLLAANQFRAALQVIRDTEPDAPAPDQFWNGGFEHSIVNGGPFYWTLTSRAPAEIEIDSEHPHSGGHSLRIVFSAPNKLESISVSQTIVVQPNSQYQVEYFVKTRDLNSGSTPRIGLVDAADNSTLGQSPAAPVENSDWQKIIFDFRTKTATQAVKLTMYREACGEGLICPIFGTVWYDDFNLQRSGGSSASR
jgi:Flp pilus assembly protein TadD